MLEQMTSLATGARSQPGVLGKFLFTVPNSINSGKIQYTDDHIGIFRGAPKLVTTHNLTTGETETFDSQHHANDGYPVAGCGSRFYCVGGITASTRHVQTNAYDVRTKTWHTLADFPNRANALGATTGRPDRFTIIGGYNGSSQYNYWYEYDIATNRWQHYASGAKNNKASLKPVDYGDVVAAFGENFIAGADEQYNRVTRKSNIHTIVDTVWSDVPILRGYPALYKGRAFLIVGIHAGRVEVWEIHNYLYPEVGRLEHLGDLIIDEPNTFVVDICISGSRVFLLSRYNDNSAYGAIELDLNEVI